MTKIEAAEKLKAILEEATSDENAVCYVTSYDADTLEMAIKALEQTEPVKRGDCISRTELLKKQQIIIDEHGLEHKIVHIGKIIDAPSVEPERKKGKWIEKEGYDGDVYYDCSVCGNPWTTIDGTPWENGMNYCPSCGARMEVQNG